MISQGVIIDDDRGWAETLAEVLRRLGFRVKLATNGKQGLRLVQGRHPELVILDIDLPNMSGIQVLRRLRKAGVRSPVIVISARDRSEAEADAMEAGADAFLSKPVSLSELRSTIRSFAPPHRTEREQAGQVILAEAMVTNCRCSAVLGRIHG